MLLFVYIFYFLFFLIFFFFFNDTATTEIYTLSLHDALPIPRLARRTPAGTTRRWPECSARSEEHTSELQSQFHLVCRLLLEKKKQTQKRTSRRKTKKRTELTASAGMRW